MFSLFLGELVSTVLQVRREVAFRTVEGQSTARHLQLSIRRIDMKDESRPEKEAKEERQEEVEMGRGVGEGGEFAGYNC